MPDQKTIEYVQTSLAQGKPKEEIYKELLGQGLSVEIIQESFRGTTTEAEKAEHSKKTIHLIVTIGAVLIGAGIFSFIASNWQYMDKPLKIGIILLSMFASYSLGWYLKEKAGLEKTGDALILLGAIIYGGGIFLVAQMFNIRANWPDGFILWMIGTVALAFAVESYPLFYLAIPLGLIAVIGQPFAIFDSFEHDPFLLTSSFLLLIATVLTFATGWVVRKRMPADLKDYF